MEKANSDNNFLHAFLDCTAHNFHKNERKIKIKYEKKNGESFSP